MTDEEILKKVKERLDNDLKESYDNLDKALDNPKSTVTIAKYSARRKYIQEFLEDLIAWKRSQTN